MSKYVFELDELVGLIETSYHYASAQYGLPNPNNAAYAANQPSGRRWSCAMEPREISERVRTFLEGKAIEEDEDVA